MLSVFWPHSSSCYVLDLAIVIIWLMLSVYSGLTEFLESSPFTIVIIWLMLEVCIGRRVMLWIWLLLSFVKYYQFIVESQKFLLVVDFTIVIFQLML
jgi:hypothetical protein